MIIALVFGLELASRLGIRVALGQTFFRRAMHLYGWSQVQCASSHRS